MHKLNNYGIDCSVKSNMLAPMAPALMNNLFNVMNIPGGEENEYAMKGKVLQNIILMENTVLK
jgi:hypothetical protein